MKSFCIFLAFVLANLAVGAVEIEDEDREMNLPFMAKIDRRLAPVAPIATDPAGATVTISVATPVATVITNPASGGENPRYTLTSYSLFGVRMQLGLTKS